MDDEVVIHIRTENDTARGNAAARADANMTAADIEGTFKKSGPRIGERLSGGVKSGLSSGFLSSIPLAGQFAIGASPIIGAALSAAVIGGAGIGGVLGGIMLVKDNPQVKAAGTALGKNLLGSLQSDAEVFIQPVLGAVGKIGDAFDTKLRPRIANVFQNASKFVEPLTDGIISFLDGATRGFDALVSKAGPVIGSIKGLLGNVGDAVGDMLETISGGSEGAAKFLDDLSDALGGVIRGLGYLIRGLSEAYSWIHDNAEATGMWIHELASGEEEVGSFARHVATADGALADMTIATEESTKSLKELADEMQAQTDPLFALIDAQRDVAEAQRDYNKALDKHGPRSAETKEALSKLGAAAVGLNSKVGDAAGGFDGRLTPAMRTALRNAKLTDGQINALEKQLRSAAKAANAWEGTFKQTFITERRTLITSNGRTFSTAAGSSRDNGRAHGGIQGAASGHIGDGLTMVGEYGPELIDLPPGSQVHSNPDTQRMMSGAGSGGGGGPIVVNLLLDGVRLATQIVAPLQKINRDSYAGDVTRMFPATR